MQHIPMSMFGKYSPPLQNNSRQYGGSYVKPNNNIFTLKAGDSFVVSIKETDEKNRPLRLIDYDISCQVRTIDGEFVCNLDVELANQITKPGEFVLRCNNTQDWDYYKRLYFDIQYYKDETTWSSPTMEILITNDITKNDVF